jgi:hypothetical protein
MHNDYLALDEMVLNRQRQLTLVVRHAYFAWAKKRDSSLGVSRQWKGKPPAGYEAADD